MKILMLVGRDNQNLFFDSTNEYEGCFFDIYKKTHFARILRNSMLVRLSLDSWRNEINQYDVVFVIDSIITPETVKWICKHRGNTRVILYFRNKINTQRWNVETLKSLPLEVWSYNLHDCKKYGFRYNCEVANRRLYSGLDTSKAKYSLCFVGANKGRDKDIEFLYNHLKHSSLLPPYLYMTGGSHEIWNMCTDNKYLPYSTYLSITAESIAILDFVSDSNYGLTVRAVEAMFLKKKLVTNYKDITCYDFYEYGNVFILGVDDIDRFEEFLHAPYQEIPESIVNGYSTDEWIKRFINAEQSEEKH